MKNFFPEEERALLEKGLLEPENKVNQLLADTWAKENAYTRPEAPSEVESGEQLLCKFKIYSKVRRLLQGINILGDFCSFYKSLMNDTFSGKR